MTVTTLTLQEAMPYFWHPAHGDMSGEDWMQFRAFGGVCGAFHQHLWPGVWMVHVGMLKDSKGRGDEAAKVILQYFAAEAGAERIIGWVKESNRAVLAMSRRVGFEIDGRLPLAEPVIMLGWGPKWA